MNDLMQILFALLGAFGFSVLFNVKGKKLIFAGIGGGVSFAAYLLFSHLNSSDFIPNFFAAMVATLYAEVCARLLKSPATIFLIGSIIPMVPGGMLYYTMQYGVAKDWVHFAPQGEQTVVVAMALAGGIMMMSSARRIIHGMKVYVIKSVKRKSIKKNSSK